MSLEHFHPATVRWFTDAFGTPTSAQDRGWASIRQGHDTLISAPTGSGKTLAAFLTALDDLLREGLAEPLPDEVRIVYVSPLKALSADIHRNLFEPRRGIRRAAEELGVGSPRITTAVRTGDTPQPDRVAMLRTPPHVLVTTPESLYLLLTAERSRKMLQTVRTVIVDEIHAVIGTRRGAHLALSLERLQQVATNRLVRLGLSATQKPIEEVARFLVGTRAIDASGRASCMIVDEGHRRELDLDIEVPRSTLEAVMSSDVWEEYYDRLTVLIRQHRTTIVFVNTRRMAERIARHLTERLGEEAVTAHHGSLSKEKRLDAETRLKEGRLKALVATSSLELGIDIGHVDLVCQIGSPHRIATFIQRTGRSGHRVSGVPKGRLLPTSRDDLIECIALVRSVRRGDLDAIVPHDAPLDVLAQQLIAETSCREYTEDDLFTLVRGAWPFRDLDRRDFDAVVRMAAEGFATRRGRRGALIHRDEVHSRLLGRRGARLTALTSGGAIPEVADYRVILEPEDTFIGTLNEDFAIESAVGDVFQLGNASWRVLRVGPGTVRVADARGVPPNLPFWLGEAPARTDELSESVSELREQVDALLDRSTTGTIEWLQSDTRIPLAAAEQAIAYLAAGRQALGVVPTTQTLVLERFFDDAGGMQLVLHAPFGSRINRAWGLALRKRFCRQFNFELQAAATDEALLLSLGPQHSFPLADVFRYLHPSTVRDLLVQAVLDAPVFQTRWRWNTTVALAVPRNRGGKRVPPQLQRMLADDLLAEAFPDAAACLENVGGDREIPDHPLVAQTIRDCLHESMDFDGLMAVLERIQQGAVRLLSRDTPEPSPFAHEILNARPYAFLDDAPLEERRAQAVYARSATEPASDSAFGELSNEAIGRVRDEARPDPRDADELHDALLATGFLTAGEGEGLPADLFDRLMEAGRVVVMHPSPTALWVAAERLPEMLAIHPDAPLRGRAVPPPARASRSWTRESATVGVLRDRLTILGPTTAAALACSCAIDEAEANAALLALEADGVALRGRFSPGTAGVEWCDRSLLARIHRHTLDRLRAEIAPVSPADFMRFLFAWQHVELSSRLVGLDGLRAIIAVLDGCEIAASSWERVVLPARMDRYERAMLDTLCLTGEVGWARLSKRPGATPTPATRLVGTTPVALFLREHADWWLALSAAREDAHATPDVPPLSEAAGRLLEALRTRGASFLREVRSRGETEAAQALAIGELVAAGLVASDGFAGIRAVVRATTRRSSIREGNAAAAGRWSLLRPGADGASRDAAVEAQAWSFLRRYGVVFRRLLSRETNAVAWRELTRVYRRLEARGEIRGGRFVSGMTGEQFALPAAISRLRETRRTPEDGRLLVIGAVDPLNLAGIVTAGERIRAGASSRMVYRNGVPVAVLEGEYMRPLIDNGETSPADLARILTGRRRQVTAGGFVGRAGGL